MTTTDEAVRLVQRYADAGTAGDLAAMDDIFTADFINHHPAGDEVGVEALKAFVAGVRARLANLTVTIDDAFANASFPDGPRVAALVTLRGRVEARDQDVVIREMWIFRVSGGKLAERWYVVEQPGSPR